MDERKLHFITRVKITHLFGYPQYTYDIPFPEDESVSIITGFNGYGKTTILRMISSIFYFDPEVFEETPFDEFCLFINDGYWIKVTKDPADNKGCKCLISSKDIEPFPLTDENFIFDPEWLITTSSELRNLYDFSDSRNLSFLDRMNIFRQTKNRTRLTQEEWKIIRKIILGRSRGQFVRMEFSSTVNESIPNYQKIRKIADYVNITFIDTQRLIIDSHVEGIRHDSKSIAKYCKKMSKHIRNVDNKYHIIAKQLDDSFPERLVDEVMSIKDQSSRHAYSLYRNSGSSETKINNFCDNLFGEIQKKIDDLEKMRQPYVNIGLLSKHEDKLASKIEDMARNTSTDEINIFTPVFLGKMMDIYIDNTAQKLKCYEDLFKKTKQLQEIFSSKVSNKELILDRIKGFLFRLVDNKPDSTDSKVSLTKLSSGEQHLFVIFYQLLFEVQEGSTVLIDEPEISIHITWQQEFYKDIAAIAETKNIKFIIATHSVDVVDDKWTSAYDLYTKCRGIDEQSNELQEA